MREYSIQMSIEKHLEELCVKLPNRHVGSQYNRLATDYFSRKTSEYGFSVSSEQFDCIDWEYEDTTLRGGEESFAAQASPYSTSIEITAELVSVATPEELKEATLTGKIVLLSGDIAREQLMPKNFVFYNPEHHQVIIRLLEEKAPAAIIAATARNPELAGSLYPFPLIEDGDFDIPSAFMTDIEGDRLKNHTGQQVTLCINSRRIPAKGYNVVARKGSSAEKVVFSAHIDSKKSTPGAIDNATGVALLLALAELMKDYRGYKAIELVAFNGEDYYAVPGQMLYIANDGFRGTKLAVNIDGLGYKNTDVGYSLYECPEQLSTKIHGVLGQISTFKEIPQWPQGDHMIFAMNGVPTISLTSDNIAELCRDITHTERDNISVVNTGTISAAAHQLKNLFDVI